MILLWDIANLKWQIVNVLKFDVPCVSRHSSEIAQITFY